ncbi:helix-turn-helix domain-containing protein [Demequina capsici]|uniref:Helix-turn-helix domain-containing protein n=1 Tax=Demequina capsici TaxID=3075620 RepID=A0AA96F7I6_9MICO|nr:helix-turn-helix domain-containing protein [Demequina sp. OYTSA14]WNM25233.1 helix-turn-helix domain-containing protein [Demequina sp. OYTSA14]
MRGNGSLSILAWVLRVSDHEVGDPALRTLAVLADYVGDDGQAWPSIKTLCADRDLSRAAIYRHLAVLKKHRYILHGDQRLVDHLPANARPTVWFINAWLKYDGVAQDELDLGVSKMRQDETTGVSPDETAGVSPGANAVQGRKTHKKNLSPVGTQGRAPARDRVTARGHAIGYPGRECVHDMSADVHVNSRNGHTEPLCPICRRIGYIVTKPIDGEVQSA